MQKRQKHQLLSTEIREADVCLFNYDVRNLRNEIVVKSEEAEKIELDRERLESDIGTAKKSQLS